MLFRFSSLARIVRGADAPLKSVILRTSFCPLWQFTFIQRSTSSYLPIVTYQQLPCRYLPIVTFLQLPTYSLPTCSYLSFLPVVTYLQLPFFVASSYLPIATFLCSQQLPFFVPSSYLSLLPVVTYLQPYVVQSKVIQFAPFLFRTLSTKLAITCRSRTKDLLSRVELLTRSYLLHRHHRYHHTRLPYLDLRGSNPGPNFLPEGQV